MLMSIETVLKKIKAYQAKELKRVAAIPAKDRTYHHGRAVPLPLRFRAKDGYFKNSTGSTGFNPVTGEGHSFNWYALTMVIKGQLVLNSYGYSCQTSQHVGQMRRLFKILGLKHIEVEAPKGLQDLGRAMEHAVFERAALMIKSNFARNADSKRSYAAQIKAWTKAMEVLTSLGAPMPVDALEALRSAAQKRADKIEYSKARAMRKAA